MDFDTLLQMYLGEFGKYQILIILCVCSVTLNSALNNLDYIFTGAVNPYRCNIGATTNVSSSLSFSELLQFSSPLTENGEPDACLVYQYNYSILNMQEATDLLNTTNRTAGAKKTHHTARWASEPSTKGALSTIILPTSKAK